MRQETKEMMHFAVALDEMTEKIDEIKKIVEIRVTALEKEKSELTDSWKYAEEQWGLWEQKARQCADEGKVSDKLKLLHELYERDVAKLPEEMSVLFNELYSNLIAEMRRNMVVLENAGLERRGVDVFNKNTAENEMSLSTAGNAPREIGEMINKLKNDIIASIAEENDKVAGYIEKSLVFNLRDIKDGLGKNINKVIEEEKESISTLNSKIERIFDGFMSEMFEAVEGTRSYWFMGTVTFLLLANLVMTLLFLLKK